MTPLLCEGSLKVSITNTYSIPLQINVQLRVDLKSLHLLIAAIERVISTQPANQTSLLSELNKLRNDMSKVATALSHLVSVIV